jgi:hypothetical protein
MSISSPVTLLPSTRYRILVCALVAAGFLVLGLVVLEAFPSHLVTPLTEMLLVLFLSDALVLSICYL